MMCMMFGQLSNRDSLRDLLVCLTTHKTKHYHLGFGKNISRSNLAEANEKRDCQIFEMYAYELIAEVQKIYVSNVDFDKSITGNVYAFDSTTIDLCLNVFWWQHLEEQKERLNCTHYWMLELPFQFLCISHRQVFMFMM